MLQLLLFIVVLLSPIDTKEDADYADGDIVTSNNERVVRPDLQTRWPMIIPYYIDPSLDNYVNVITSAVNEYQRTTCLVFDRLNATSGDPWPEDYLYFNSSSGCSSFVGRQGGEQLISIEAEICTFKGVVLHEIFHSLGFLHEHNRPDRDDYIDILWDNVDPEMYNNLTRYSEVEMFGQSYDYMSISHGSNYLYALDKSKPTLLSKANPEMLLGQRERLSSSDVYRINSYYPCPTTIQTSSEQSTSTEQPETSNWSTTATPVGSRTCDGASESTVVPHPLDCTKFYLCQGWTALEMKCPAGLLFNAHKSICDWPSAVTDCPRTTVPYS